MRYYRPDGTYHDYPNDTEFGWFFEDITVDEATPNFREENENIKKVSQLHRPHSGKCGIEETPNVEEFKCHNVESVGESEVEESVDVLEDLSSKPALIHKIDLNIKEETPTNSVIPEQTVEGFIESPHSNFLKQVLNYKIPSKKDLIALINPVNPESKALLSIVSYTTYSRLDDQETNEEVLKTINFKATNSKWLINEETSTNYLVNDDKFANINFLVNDNEVDLDNQMASEIKNYHATKEDNMLSLMMELINTDLDSNLGDMSEQNNSLNEFNSAAAVVTSDLGNSIHSSILSKEGNGLKEKRERRNYLEIPNRSDILSSIGLSDDIDRSIQSFVDEKTEMYQQLMDIKRSFEDFDKEIDTLMDKSLALQNDLRETTYLNNLIHLLKGHPEKVKNKKLPFRIFHQSIDDEEANANLIL